MPTRVLFLITDLQIGGTPRVVRDLATRLRSPAMQTTVACLAPWGPVADELQSAGVPVHALGVRHVWQLAGAVREFRKLARNFDVVFSHLVHANAVAALALRALPELRLVEAIHTTQPYPAWHWKVQGFAARRAAAIVAPSASVVQIAVHRAHIPPDRLTLIPHAIDFDRFASLERAPAARFRVGFIGRLDPIKRVPDLLQAVAALPNVELHVFGDGEDRAPLAHQIAHRQLADRVTLHGTIASAADALPHIDLLVLPSDAEGFGIVLLEAMAAGVPVIGTDVPGIRDVIAHENNGLLVPPRSPALIAQAIERLRHDAPLRTRLTTQARAHVRQAYTWDRILPQYEQVLQGHPSPAV
ncbi:MAG: glycosyltransferase family 4 protein [Tepidisphaeraceae bacterium]